MNLWSIFFTGLITGGLSCMAVQGGLLAATIAQREEERLKEKVKNGSAVPIVSFLLAKLGAYTLLGLLLGSLGSVFQLSLTVKTILQFAVAFFMVGTALNILNIHPIFRYFVIQPPRFLTRLVRRQSKSKDLFAPALLGAFTIFIPCGTTQAMMALAIASGNPIQGALILFSFVLGTSPLFFILGYFATRLGDALHEKFMKIAAYGIILLAIFNLNNALALTGSGLSLENFGNVLWCTISICNDSKLLTSNKKTTDTQQTNNQPTITITNSGYNPNNISVQKGSQVKLTLINKTGSGCVQAFTIPSLNIQKIVPLGSSSSLTFTAPSKPGSLAFMCSMGMYRGTIQVI